MYNEVNAKNHIEGAHNEVARFTRLFMVVGGGGGGWWGWWYILVFE